MDGLIEARAGSKEQFGVERLKRLIEGFSRDMPLPEIADKIRAAAVTFTGAEELQDDLTLLLFQRLAPAGMERSEK